MARLKSVDEISDMVGDLATIMKMSMGKGDSFTSIENEIRHSDRYLNIMKKRFADRLKVIKRIDSSLSLYQIPKLLIQPLIENAIYHGIDKRREGGYIYIGITKDEDHVKLMICDSGKGIDENDVKIINKQLLKTSDDYFYNLKENQKSNIGIENVNRRIKLYFGEQYGIKIESKLNHYTKVVAVLPLEGISGV